MGGGGRVEEVELWGGGVVHGSQNPDPISDQNILLSIPFFRPDLEMKQSLIVLSNPMTFRRGLFFFSVVLKVVLKIVLK